jgi:hypothetical protein
LKYTYCNIGDGFLADLSMFCRNLRVPPQVKILKCPKNISDHIAVGEIFASDLEIKNISKFKLEDYISILKSLKLYINSIYTSSYGQAKFTNYQNYSESLLVRELIKSYYKSSILSELRNQKIDSILS